MTLLDWIIFGGLILGLIGVAWSCRHFARSVADFLVVGRKMRKYLGLSTGTAEGIGLVSIAYMAEQGFNNGFAYVWLTLMNMAIYVPLFGLIGFGIRRFRTTRAMTIPQYHEMRYSRGVRICVGFALAIGGILNMAIFPIVSSQFLIHFLDLPPQFEIAGVGLSTQNVLMLILIGSSLTIAIFGGMVTVIVTDYAQAVVLALAMFGITAVILFQIDLATVHAALDEKLGAAAFNPFVTEGDNDAGYGMVWVMFFVLSGVLAPLTFPPSTAKLSSADSPATARKMALIGGLFNSGRAMLILFWGVAALAAYPLVVGAEAAAADPNPGRYFTAEYLHTVVPMGLMGFCAAGLVFAYISTDNSYYLAWSAIIVNDIITPIRKKPLEGNAQIRLIRIVMVFIAVFLFVYGLVYDPTESILAYLYLTGVIFTAAGIVTMIGLYWPRANTWGAYLTVAICMGIPLADLIGKQVYGDRYPLRGEQSGLLALLLSFAAFAVCGFLTTRGRDKWKDYGKLIQAEDKSAAKGHQA